MRITDLPADVLTLVFRAVHLPFRGNAADAKVGIVLLSVCRLWRAIALPVAYSKAFIRCGAGSRRGVESLATETTLDLVASAKCQQLVRQLSISVFCYDNPFPALTNVIAKLREVAGEWAHVRKLVLAVDVQSNVMEQGGTLISNYEESIAGSSSALAALLPGLREVQLNSNIPTRVAGKLCGLLIAHYPDRLQTLHSNCPLVVPQDQVFTRLRDVSITGLESISYEYRPPRIDPATVKSLELKGGMVNNAWSMFGDDDGHAMTFSHLRRLCMRFGPINYMAPDQPSGGRPRALRFPELQHINIVSDGSACSFMDNAVFPSSLESLVITAGAALYQRLAKAKLQVTNKLELHLRHDPVGDTGIVAAANHILEAADGCRDTRLIIAGPARVPLELFTYTKLTHLELTAPTSVDDMMAHIHSQPRLVSLAVNNLVLTNCKTDLSIPSSTEHELVTPLDTQIGVLSIGGAHSSGWQKKGVAMLKYLLLKMPTLSEVRAQRIPSKPIQAFVNKYAQQYPHLANVRLQLSSSN